MNHSVALSDIKNKIFTIRGVQVMIDNDLANLYQVETRMLNQAVKRNSERFPEDFMFQLSSAEWENLISQNEISSWGGRRSLPYVFTEQGISALSGVLKSKIAVKINIAIMRTFVMMRKLLIANTEMLLRLDTVEKRQIASDIKVDEKFDKVFDALENKEELPKQGVFFGGQVFDAHVFISKLIRKTRTSLIIIDNYVDESTLTLLSKANRNIKITLLTKTISKKLQLDIDKYNAQYKNLKAINFDFSHDRFLIIDNKEIYHIGASLKDLGKKLFAFSLLEKASFELMKKIDENLVKDTIDE